MKNEMADAKLDITVRPGGNYTLSLESKKKQEAIDAEKALAQKQGVPVLVNPTTRTNEVGTVPLGIKMRVGHDDVTVEKKTPAVQSVAQKGSEVKSLAQTQNPVVNPPFNNWSVYQPAVKHDKGLDAGADLGQNIIVDGHKVHY